MCTALRRCRVLSRRRRRPCNRRPTRGRPSRSSSGSARGYAVRGSSRSSRGRPSRGRPRRPRPARQRSTSGPASSLTSSRTSTPGTSRPSRGLIGSCPSWAWTSAMSCACSRQTSRNRSPSAAATRPRTSAGSAWVSTGRPHLRALGDADWVRQLANNGLQSQGPSGGDAPVRLQPRTIERQVAGPGSETQCQQWRHD